MLHLELDAVQDSFDVILLESFLDNFLHGLVEDTLDLLEIFRLHTLQTHDEHRISALRIKTRERSEASTYIRLD